MRIRQRKDITPINVMPGDTVHLTWRDERGVDHELLQDTILEPRVIDRVAVVDLEGEELDDLDLDLAEGLAGVFGRRA